MSIRTDRLALLEDFAVETSNFLNPMDPDTDDDGLFDGEWFGWNISVKSIGSTLFITEHVSSNPLLKDTDADGLDDFIEFHNGTNPSAADTDLDGLWDIRELALGTEPNNWDSDGDSLSDGEEVNIYHTDPLVQDTDSDGLSDAEEIKSINVLTRTNPLLNDTDADGLLDSQEVFDMTEVLTDSSGKEVRPKVTAGTAQTFYIRNVANIRTAQSASATVQISSGEGRAKNVQYALEYGALRNGRLYTSGMVRNEPYHAQVIDVKPLMARKGASSYGGAWTLTVWADYDCVVEEFSLSLSGLLDGNDPDSDDDLISDGVESNPQLNDGWLTDPFKADTDGDGWDDFREIHATGTNPCARDSDADGVIDPSDIAPLKDVLVEVSIEHVGMVTDYYSDRLQVGLTTLDKNDYRGLFSPRVAGNSYPGLKYYFDVSDSIFNTRFDLYAKVHYIAGGNYENVQKSRSYGSISFNYLPQLGFSQLISAGAYEPLQLRFTLVGLDRVNTIATHSEGALVNGRFASPQKMAVVQLDIKLYNPMDIFDIQDTPFTFGSNVIVMPSDSFLESKLHSIVEKSVNGAGQVDWGSVPECLKTSEQRPTNFVGMDRSKGDGSDSKDVELMITREGCSVSDALQILQLLQTGVVNETTGEEGIIFIYNSTKVEGFTAVGMNLPLDVLKLIPLIINS